MSERVNPTMENLLRVVIVQRSEFPTLPTAAAELGYKNPASLSQRLVKLRKAYPEFKNAPEYPRGRTTAKADEVSALLAKLQAAQAEQAEGETPNE